MNIDYTELILAVLKIALTVLGFIIAKYLIPWLKKKNLDGFAEDGVRLAYSLFKTGEGKKKFDLVLEKAKTKFGKWFSVDEIVAAIQAAYVNFCIERGITPSPANDVIATDKKDETVTTDVADKPENN